MKDKISGYRLIRLNTEKTDLHLITSLNTAKHA